MDNMNRPAPEQTMPNGNTMPGRHDLHDCHNWTVAMAYVPWQDLNELNEPAQALHSGTLFPELEKPFYGTRRRNGR